MKTLFLSGSFLLFSMFLFADNYTDSLTKKMQSGKETEQAYYLNLLSRHYYESAPDTCKKMATQALEIALKYNNIKEEATAYYNLGAYYFVCTNYNTSIDYFIRAFQKYNVINDMYGIASSMNGIGLIYELQGDYYYALSIYKNALIIMKAINNIEGIAGTRNNIAKIYFNQKKYHQALTYLQDNLTLAKKFRSEAAINKCLHNINVVLIETGKYSMALKNYEEILKSQRKLNKSEAIITLRNIGKLHHLIKNTNAALKDYFEAIELSKESDNKSIISTIYTDIGTLYFEEKDYNRALKYIDLSLRIAKEHDLDEQLIIDYQLLSEIYEKQGKYEKALINYKIFKSKSDSNILTNQNKQIANFRNNYETIINEKKIENLKKETEIQNLTINKQFYIMLLLISISFFLGLTVFVFVRRYRRKQQTAKILEATCSELKESSAMQERIISLLAHDLKSPIVSFYGITNHMFDEYDNLSDSIIKKYLEQLVSAAKAVMEILENTLQWALLKKDKQLLIHEKINLLELVNYSFSFFSVSANKKNVLMTTDIKSDVIIYSNKNMLMTILRNLISNAVKFTRNQGEVFVTSTHVKDKIQIIIKDTGVGIPDENLSKILQPGSYYSTLGTAKETGSGLGLTLSKEMMELCGGTLTLTSEVGKGTIAIIEIPTEIK
jgi:signal transduction histidine kinase